VALLAAASRGVLGHGQALAVAASNVAVDNLAVGLLAASVNVVRMGQPVKVLPRQTLPDLHHSVSEYNQRTSRRRRPAADRIDGISCRLLGTGQA